jgi:hypothetical protein
MSKTQVEVITPADDPLSNAENLVQRTGATSLRRAHCMDRD